MPHTPVPLSSARSPANSSTPITMRRITEPFSTLSRRAPILAPSIIPTTDGTAIIGSTAPLFTYTQAADESTSDSTSPDVPAETFNGAPINRLSAGTLAHPAPMPNMPASTPMPRNKIRPPGVRCTCQLTRPPVAPSMNTPLSASALDRRWSGAVTCGNSDFLDRNISTTMPSTITPSAVCTAAAGSASPINAPAIELAEASTASGSARRRLARPPRNNMGAAASALARATSRPAPRTKSRWNGKEAAHDGHEQRAPANARRHSHDAHQEAGDEQRQRPEPPRHRRPPRRPHWQHAPATPGKTMSAG